ncbi:MAG TPA: dUTP diphosphatase [Candidatus Paceibacterota bacterium]|nr:dUTP diphosphatase [Candidatus Paceibacterota bacterium]
MRIRIKRIDASLPLPSYQTEGAAAFDLAAREGAVIAPGTVGYVPVNIALETPPDHFLLVAARSSTHKKGLMMANGIGVVDSDFRGDGDEIRVACYNFTQAPVTIEKGERIAQGTFVRISKAEWDETDRLGNKARGGFGTTGER